MDAARYDRTRPPYPAALADRIIAASPGTDVLDVGTGTGIVARQFQAAGCRVLGVEPDARMAEFARSTGVEAEVATFEEWDPAGREFGAVVAGTAWHWVDPVAGAVKAAQVLRPGGLLAPFHHVLQPPPEVSEAASAAYRRVAPDSPFNQASRPSRSPGPLPAAVRQDRGRDPGGGQVHRTRGLAVRLGADLHPGRMAGPAPHPRLPHPAPAGGRGHGAGGRRGRDRRAGRQLHDVLHHRGHNRLTLGLAWPARDAGGLERRSSS